MLSYGITALQLMPEESTAALVIITDGILDVPNLSAFEAVMRQIRARIISCSFVQIGAMNNRNEMEKNGIPKAPIASLGHVPNEELLKFISSSTFGSFIYFDVDHVGGGSDLLTNLFSKGLELTNRCRRLKEFQHELLSWGKSFISLRLSLCMVFHCIGFHKALSDHPASSSKYVGNDLSNGHQTNSGNG